MITRRLTLSLIVVALLAGCDANFTGPLTPDDPTARWIDGQAMVPIDWTFHVQATGEEWLTCYLPYGDPFVYRGQTVVVSAGYAISGRASHLGELDPELSSASILDCSVQLTPDGMPMALGGHVTARLVGPQGDAIDLDGTLTQYPFEGYAVGDWDIVGGEGRFAGASGYIDSMEYPATDASGSVGSGSGWVTRPGNVAGGRSQD
ncbi:MAG: hypothetical protein ACN0LA_06855 [Candidatus Longimicrobiales bacterium M2_2A_002]